MKCNIGDKVRFLNDVGGGVVVGFANQSTVLVRDDDGFEIPTPISEIIVVGEESGKSIFSEGAYENRNTDKISEKNINITPKQKVEIKATNTQYNRALEVKDDDGNDFSVLLGFVPIDADKSTDSDLNFYIINDSPYRLFYTAGVWQKNNKITPLNRSELEGDSKKLITKISKKTINEVPIINICFLLFKNCEYIPQEMQQFDIEINPVKFFKPGAFAENDFFDENAYIYKLADSAKTLKDYAENIAPRDIAQAMKEKKDLTPKRPKIKQNVEIEEVDLHIEALTDNYKGMSNGDMLQMQIDRFTTALDLGIVSSTKRMVFIHGVGNGKLKHEIRRLLDTQYAGKVRYQDASFKEYGYGATMVYIK